MADEKSDYQELSDLLGKPKRGIDTGFALGGRLLNMLLNFNNQEDTGYIIGGPAGNSLINREGREIARLGGFLGNDFFAEGKPTGYFLSTEPGKRRVLYDKNKDEFLRE